MKNMDCRSLLVLIQLAASVNKAAGKLIVKPKNTDVMIYQITYFNCSTDIGPTAIFWFHGTKFVYTGSAILEPYNDRFKIERYSWNGTYIYNLIIHSVQPGDAGEYRCEEDEGVGEKFSVQLVVLDGYPTCRSNMELDEVIGQNTCNIEPDEVELECSVSYHGNIPPQLEWKKVGENSTTPSVVSVAASTNHVISISNLRGDITLNNYSYVCGTKQSNQESYNCTSKVITILYAQSDNSTVNMTIDDEIRCIANTSEPCSYKWKWLEGNDVTTESSTAVLKAKKPGLHKCETECYLRNQSCNLLVMWAMVYNKPEPSKTMNMFISFVTAVIVSIVISCVTTFLLEFFRFCDEAFSITIDIIISAVVTVVVSLTACGALTLALNYSGSSLTWNIIIHVVVSLVASLVACRVVIFALDKLYFNTECFTCGKSEEEEDRAIFGLTILHQQVFTTRSLSQNVEVYNSKTFHLERRMIVEGMTQPVNIVSCSVNNCLYIADSGYRKLLPAILRIDPVHGNLIKAWKINEYCSNISTASDTNVISCSWMECILYEYTADGELIRTINVDRQIRATHAVKLDSGLFVVCDDLFSRIHLLSTREKSCTLGRFDEADIVKKFSNRRGKLTKFFSRPEYLSLDKDGSILVTDRSKKRVVLLSPNFDKARILVSKEHGMNSPGKTCFDESTGKWLVTDGRRIMVCQVDEEKVERQIYDLIYHEDVQDEML